MAQRTTVVITDDLDGSDKNVATVQFSFEGTAYEIDLSRKNRDAFEKAISPYVRAARKAPKVAPRGTRRSTTASDDLNAIRAWARSQGHTVADRGRVAQSIKDAYYKENA